MADPSDTDDLPTTPAPTPDNLRSVQARERFAVAKYYGMGSDGEEWTAPQIADALDVSKRTVYKYLNESQIAEETREVLATTEAEWRLDMALQLRKEVQRLEEIEQELLQKKQAVPTGYEEKTVEGTPTGDHNISLADHANNYRLQIPVPTNFETVTDYGPDLERVQKEKRNYLQQISKLLGLDAPKKSEIDQRLASKHEEVKIVEFRDSNDEYPDQQVVDVDGNTAQIDIEDPHEEADSEPVESTVSEEPDDV